MVDPLNHREEIAAIDLSGMAQFINDIDACKHFVKPRDEHYKLLAWLSLQFNYIEVSDIGTFRGASACALAYNATNKVTSYDVDMGWSGHWNIPDNISLVWGDKDDVKMYDEWLKSGLICLDTTHDGTHENQVIDFLIKNKWKGVLVLDDIHHFPEQNKLWNSINLRKEDVTEVGHWSGTGIIYFE